jgi:hypothetical protein
MVLIRHEAHRGWAVSHRIRPSTLSTVDTFVPGRGFSADRELPLLSQEGARWLT